MRFLIFIYGKSRMKRTQLVSDKRAECHILLPKDDFSLERTVFLQFKNISGEWFIKETDCCHLKTEEFFQMGKRKSDEGIFYKLSIGRKNELSVGGKDLYIQLIRYRNDWSIYKKYKLRDCRIIKEKNIFIMMEKAINRKNSMGISYEYGKWFIEKCGNIEIYINEILLEKKQQLEFGDVICIGTIYLLFFENYIAVEAGERNIVSDYLEEVVLENEIKGQEDVRKKEKREITFHRAPRVMEELKKVSLKVDAPPQVDVQEKKSIFMDIGTIMNLMFPMLGMNLFLIYGMKSEQNQAGIYVYSGLFMAVMSAVCSILWLMISRKYEKREQQKKVNKERLAYRRYLNKKSEYIKVQYERVYKVLQSRYLRADTYLDSPLLDMYLWNRNLYHKDFLMYRIGIGDVEFPMKIEFPEEVFGDEENILWREAKKIKEHYEILHQIPVLLDMGRYSQIGIITKDTIAGMELVRSIILQIALCNCYTEVKIGCIYNKNKVIQSQQWDFCRWLPHIWDANRQKRFIAGNEVEARRLFYDLLQIFKEREEVSISGKAEKILPHYILFVAEEQFLEGEMFSKYILDRGREYGLTVVWLDSMRKKLPNTCKMVLEINGGFTGRYEIERHSQKKEKINFDYTEKNIAEKLIRSISGIKVMEIEEKAGIPEVVDFLGMYDVHTIEELHIKQRWEKNRIFESAKVLIGKKAGDEPFYRESVEISLKKIDDRNVLKKEWSYERAESENTVQVQWDNIKKTENSDGIYYLQIKGQDKAGNKIKDDFKVVFCVNQRGADFILSHALKKKINKYYLKEAPKIKLREQCVKQTKSRAVILKDNEERKVIGESSITSSVIADKKSERYGWYEKYYNFAKKDFEREGDYRVTFQADTKEKELRFVVDKTPPVVHIGNLDKQIYEEKEHEFTIRVMDNYAFKELELYMETDRNILGQKGTKKIIIKPKDLDENYMVRKTLTADKRYQTVRYIARDKAGNVIDSNDNGDTKVCLVTDSKTVKEYQEHKKEYMLIGIISTLGIFIVISGSGLFIFTRRKRNLK